MATEIDPLSPPGRCNSKTESGEDYFPLDLGTDCREEWPVSDVKGYRLALQLLDVSFLRSRATMDGRCHRGLLTCKRWKANQKLERGIAPRS